jgi:hypothetical protein
MTRNKHQQKPSLTHHTRNLTLMLSLGMLAGVLIWAKLRLVTDIPRSAYADPREVQPPESESENQDLESVDSEETDPDSDAEIVADPENLDPKLP